MARFFDPRISCVSLAAAPGADGPFLAPGYRVYCARITRRTAVDVSLDNHPTARARILGEFTPKWDISSPGARRLTTTRTALGGVRPGMKAPWKSSQAPTYTESTWTTPCMARYLVE